MKKSIVVITALEEELNRGAIPSHVPIIYSGLGKVNASIATFKAIHTFNPIELD